MDACSMDDFELRARESGKVLCVLRMGILAPMAIRPTTWFCTGGSSPVYTEACTSGDRSFGVV